MSTASKHPEWGAYSGPGGSWEGSAGHPSQYYDTARSLYMAPCECGGDGKLTPDGNQWEVRCACGKNAPAGGSPAIATKNWNAQYLTRETDARRSATVKGAAECE